MLKRSLQTFILLGGLCISFAALAGVMDSLFRKPGDPVGGNPKGTITIAEFFDYQCSHCVSMVGVVESTLQDNPNVRIVYKEFPIRGFVSQQAARAALAANMQGKYKQFHRALFHNVGALTTDRIYELAKENGLDVEKLKRDMKSKQVTNQIQATFRLAEIVKLTGTPAYFVGKTDAQSQHDVTFILGETSQQGLQNAIDKAAQH